MTEENILKAGKIASEVREYASRLIKPGMSLLEIAENIENKIISLGAKPAFPTNLSINDIAAHYTPGHNDETKATGLLKVDLGVHIDGAIADTAFSLDLEDSEENKKIIKAAEEALNNATKIANAETQLNTIGKAIQETIEAHGLAPIINLTGHSIDEYNLHSGITIPNHDNNNLEILGEGLRAIEPFATNGVGKIYDGKPSGIYQLTDEKLPRSPIAREVLNFIIENYQTLPFCSRWLVKELGTKALFGLKQLEENGNIRQYEHLVESSHGKVAQAEHTLLVNKDKTIITTE